MGKTVIRTAFMGEEVRASSLERQCHADDQDHSSTSLNPRATRGRPLKVRSDQEPILMGTLPKIPIHSAR